ncbi:type IV pilus biogenesis protein PilN [Desulfocucumis palustris]|uniref:Type IV pilus biogenesis protein PilN n=1 Tax=Desulfocucumis palustris TaxID=1898651 RepID=A0A2L2X951_9FIRM|nr:PilN domain-containing protein [Desulfocucumis palustris]GBF32759.1 type IV pilus biogenesis protein PilN [Desulfocucumis palustris]
MDIRINLLLPELKAAQEQKRHKQRLMLISLAVIGLFIFVYGTLFAFTLYARAGAEKLREERGTLEAGITNLKYFADLQAGAAEAGKLAQKVRGNPVDWSGVLWEMGAYLPADVWIIDFFYSEEPGKNQKQPTPFEAAAQAADKAVGGISQAAGSSQTGAKAPSSSQSKTSAKGAVAGEVTIKGQAYDQPSVSLFIDAMKNIKAFGEVYCKSSTEKAEGEQTFIDFEIKAGLRPEGQGSTASGKAGD